MWLCRPLARRRENVLYTSSTASKEWTRTGRWSPRIILWLKAWLRQQYMILWSDIWPRELWNVGKAQEDLPWIWTPGTNNASRRWLTMQDRAIAARFYIDDCLDPHLIPFLDAHYRRGGQTELQYSLWRCLNGVLRQQERHLCSYVRNVDNQTEVPQCRPVEDFFGLLSTRVYHRNWVAKDMAALKRQIRKCISEIFPATVQATMETVWKRLFWAFRVWILEVCHWLYLSKIDYSNSVYHWFYQKIKISTI